MDWEKIFPKCIPDKQLVTRYGENSQITANKQINKRDITKQ